MGYTQELEKDAGTSLSNSAANVLRSVMVEQTFNVATPSDLIGIGLESRQIVNNASQSIETVGRQVYGMEGWDSLTRAQRTAFKYSALAWNDFKGYDATASNVSISNESRLPSTGSIDHYVSNNLSVGNEAYDARNLLNSKVLTTIVNVGMARQDDFAEMFYETVVLPPDEGNITFKVEQTFVMTDYLHTGNGFGGVAKGFGSVKLVDALINPEVLRDAAISIVPLYSASNPSFSTEVASWKTAPEQGRGEIDTGALKFNTQLGLLALSMDSVLNPTQVADSTDQLDHDVRVERVFLKVAKGGNNEIIPIVLKNIPDARFVPSPLSKSTSRDLILNFSSTSTTLTGKTQTVAGVDAANLAYLRDPARENWVVYLDFNLSGQVNLETGSIRVNDGKVQIHEVWENVVDNDGMCRPRKVDNPSDLNALQAEFDSLELVGWYPLAQRTNFNRRTRGLLVRMDVWSESYTIPMGPPTSVLTPVVDTETLTNLEGPIMVNRIRNSQNALAKLKEYGDTLKQYPNANDVISPRPELEGVGRYIMRPYFEEVELDLEATMDSVRSADRLEDLNHALVTQIRSMATRAWMLSNYGPAWQAMGVEGKPIVNIGLNAELASYLDLKADARLLGEYFDSQVAITYNREISDTIYMNFTAKGDNVCFKSGNFYFIPEVVSTLPKTTNGGQSVQLTVQNRNMHLNHAPIQLRIKVKGLKNVLEKKIAIKTV